MSLTLPGSFERLAVHFWWETPAAGRRLEFHEDPLAARAFLGRLGGLSGDAALLRRFVGEHLPGAALRMDDAALFDELARWLAAGTLRMTSVEPARTAIPRARDQEEEEAAAPRRTARAVVEEGAAPVEPATFAEDVDRKAVVASLKKAAEDGLGFCKVCRERAERRRAQALEAATFAAHVDTKATAEGLKKAAEGGVGFCKVCQKNRSRR